MKLVALSLSILSAPLVLASAEDWPGWRGPTANGVSPSKAPLTWDAETNVKWRTPLAHPANGSPVVSGDRIFLTTPGDPEGKERALECYARESGELLWQRTIEFGRKMPTHNTNPYCGTTPACEGDRVVVWHASAGLYCYDFEGEEKWRRDLGEFKHQWGYGTSPVLRDGVVYLNTGPGEVSMVIAVDLESGETIWETVEPDFRTDEERQKERLAGSWCTPILVETGGETQLVCGQPTRVVGYDLETGDIVWTCDGVAGKNGNLTYSSPVMADDVCVVVGGYSGPTLGVRVGGEGDVTETHRVWRHARQLSNCASGVFVNGRVIVPDMKGTLWCIDPATGLPDWRERVSRGGTWGSIVIVGELLYILTQSGTTVVFRADEDGLEIVHENVIEEATNSTLAIADGEIYLRTHEHLYCIADGQ
ncbi:MAG: PQQ-binding-like beta-propeller repeat protein [Planctomycetota bacterium]